MRKDGDLVIKTYDFPLVYSKGSLLPFPNGTVIMERINITKGLSPLRFRTEPGHPSCLMNGV